MKLFFLVDKSNLYQRVKLAAPLVFGVITILIGRNLSLKFAVSPAEKMPKKNETRDFLEFDLPENKAIISLAIKNPSNPLAMQLMDED
ncbi:hypothetical protein [Serratia bockelmannii]|uniref:hypothetical protein n=1 Tax=Serratia bockelmannii TaxID=2703793 RepID=UPI00331510F1